MDTLDEKFIMPIYALEVLETNRGSLVDFRITKVDGCFPYGYSIHEGMRSKQIYYAGHSFMLKNVRDLLITALCDNPQYIKCKIRPIRELAKMAYKDR